MEYTLDANIYGKYDDPYLKDEVNPFLIDMTTTGEHVQLTDRKPNPVTVRMKYDRLGKYMDYNHVDITKEKEKCPEEKECPGKKLFF